MREREGGVRVRKVDRYEGTRVGREMREGRTERVVYSGGEEQRHGRKRGRDRRKGHSRETEIMAMNEGGD